VPGYVEALHWLDDLRAAGKVELIGTTNFDTARLAEIVASGVSVATNQLQYSVLDHRPENGLAAFCAAHGIKLLCYGTLAGGFIGERWRGAPEPRPPFANRSLVKYRLIIDDFGGWPRFQELLSVLDAIAKRHHVSIASVAIRYVLDKPGVALAIVGARNAAHLEGLVQAVALDESDRRALSRVSSQATGPRGDCYELERVENGPHSMIMWKNQNTGGAPADGLYVDAPPAAERESR
jgi:aryl-alcohol dehydrogenase-like predicted oxidoreductase